MRGHLVAAMYGLVVWLFAGWPTTAALSCGLPGRPVDGWYVPVSPQQSYLPGSEIQYFCDPKQLLFNPSKRVCLVDGTWSGNIPLCEKPVKVQSALQSTILDDFSATKALDMSYSTCSTSQYQAESHWTAFLAKVSTVTAVRISLPLGDDVDLEVLVKNEGSLPVGCGRFTGNTGMKHITKVFYCPSNTEGLLVHVQDYIKTKHYFQLCEVEIFIKRDNPCLNPDIPNNGYGNKRSSGKATTFHYFCTEGYELNGASEAVCLPNGTWSPKAPTCEPITCKPPQTLQSGSITYEATGGQVPYGGSASYKCNPGFVLQGDAIRQCKRKDQWSGILPVCVAAGCDSPLPSVPHGWLKTNASSIRSEALLQCNKGYRIWGADRLVCLSTGRWSSETLMCVPIQCEDIHTIPHGSVKLLDESTFYGSYLQVICYPGYTTRGDPLRRCLEDGSWENLTEACVEVFCEQLPVTAVDGGRWIPMFGDEEPPRPGAMMMLECSPRFERTGSPPTTTCQGNGTWSPRTAACIEIGTAEATTGAWRNELPPSVMMIIAISVGAGTAVCILCVVSAVLMFKRRHQTRSNTTVFHVGIPDGTPSYKEYLTSPEEHYYTTALYEEVPEPAVNPPIKPRKPCSPLPPPPLEAEPFYSQPFEVESGIAYQKCSSSNHKDSNDIGHIYSEPVDTRCNSDEQRDKTLVLCDAKEQRQTRTGHYLPEGGFADCQPNSVYEKLEGSFPPQLSLNETPEESAIKTMPTKSFILQSSLIKDNSLYSASPQNTGPCEILKVNSVGVKMVDMTVFWSDSDVRL